MPITITDQMRQAIRLAGRPTSHRTATPAMRIADPGTPDPHPSQRLRPHAQNRAADLSLTAPSNRPRIQITPDDQPPGARYRAVRMRGNQAMSPRQPRPSDSRRATTRSPVPPETSGPGTGPAAERLAYSVDEAARLTGLSRDLLYDEMRRGNLSYVKVGRRRLITRQHLQQFLGLAL
ncbi:MAG TPA: helix-turn-helix domain-containing protein [Streptosporangiaceae bacterium]|nr:helix-turn-helix domain-containing protein [Streptosporangiaceae bacterium]